MSEDCDVTGKITSAVPLWLNETYIDYGKWVYGPNGSVDAGSAIRAFEAQGRKGTATGTNGDVTYKAADSARFKLSFDCPYSKQNQASIIGVDGPFQKYSYRVEYPSSGETWDANYYISKIQSAAVANDTGLGLMSYAQFVDMVACREYPLDQIKTFMGGKELVGLKDVLELKDMPGQLKIWLAINGLFLDEAWQRRVTAAFVEHVFPLAEKIKLPGVDAQALMAALKKANAVTASGAYDVHQAAVRDALKAGNLPASNLAAVDAMLQALGPYPDSAFKNATT